MPKVPQEGATYEMLLCTHPPTSKAAPASLSTSSWPSDMLDVPWTPTLYLDESGDPNPRSASEEYPVFVLGGVICESEYVDTVVRAALNRIKQELFGRTDFPLHTAEFKRYRGPFRALRGNDPMRALLRIRLLELLEGLDYTIVACAIPTGPNEIAARSASVDLYLAGLQALVETFCDIVGSANAPERSRGRIIAEARRPREDRAVLREWRRIVDEGTRSYSSEIVHSRIESLSIQAKSDLNPGLELADLVVSPIGRHVIKKPDSLEWDVVRSKLHRGPNGEIEGHGLIHLPSWDQ